MTASSPCGKDLDDRLEAAAAWRVRIEEDATVCHSPAFLSWIADSANREAYGRTTSTWALFGEYTAAPEILALRSQALHRARMAFRRSFFPRRRILRAMAATLVLAAFGGLGAWQFWFGPAEYRTGIGERRTITLEDGSRVSLDSDTEVRVEYSERARNLVLEHGRARFDVAHNVNRPFTVTAEDETVVAVGTSFSVERINNTVLVTMIEGRVVVKSSSGKTKHLSAPARKLTSLIAGQELIVKANALPVIRVANLPVATAWETGRLVFNNEPLGEAVARVNRYTDKPLAVDPSVANVHISGVFNAGDVSAFIDAVTSYFPVSASTSADGRIVLQKRS